MPFKHQISVLPYNFSISVTLFSFHPSTLLPFSPIFFIPSNSREHLFLLSTIRKNKDCLNTVNISTYVCKISGSVCQDYEYKSAVSDISISLVRIPIYSTNRITPMSTQ